MNTLDIYTPKPLPINRKRDYVFIFEDYELAFPKTQLAKITLDWNNGKEIEQISKEQKRHEMEILLALIYQASRNKVNRPYAYKIKEELN